MFPTYIGTGGLIFALALGVVCGLVVGALLRPVSKWLVVAVGVIWLIAPLVSNMWDWWYVHFTRPTGQVYVHVPGFYLWLSVLAGLIIAVARGIRKKTAVAVKAA